MELLENPKFNILYLASIKLTDDELKIARKNPHCIEYFATNDRIKNCTSCYNVFNKNKLIKLDLENYIKNRNKINNKNNNNDLKKCKNECFIHSYVYPVFRNSHESDEYMTNKIDKFKLFSEFKKDKLLYKLDDIKYSLDYELTTPKPKTVIHWGQIKMFLVTLVFLLKTVSQDDDLVNIVYIGSAHGDNILLLSDMFPNIDWYLVDPNPYHPKIYNHPKIKEVKNEYFTDELAEYYKKKLRNQKHKLLFISDIRISGKLEDKDIIIDQEMNRKWLNILDPDFSYLKFRCPYVLPENYDYIEGKIYIQPFAPPSSTETRLLVPRNPKNLTYSSKEYNGKMIYFNRVLRSSYYKSLIDNHPYLDHCYDCTYFTYLIKNYITHYNKFNPYGTNIKNICQRIIDFINIKRTNKLMVKTKEILFNLH
jgi:hypothetical protein